MKRALVCMNEIYSGPCFLPITNRRQVHTTSEANSEVDPSSKSNEIFMVISAKVLFGLFTSSTEGARA